MQRRFRVLKSACFVVVAVATLYAQVRAQAPQLCCHPNGVYSEMPADSCRAEGGTVSSGGLQCTDDECPAQPCTFRWLPGFGQTGTQSPVTAAALFDDGCGLAAYVGAEGSYMMKFDGASWERISDDQMTPRVLLAHDDGTGPSLYAGGRCLGINGAPGTYLAKWAGSTWIPIVQTPGNCDDIINTMASFNDGTGRALYIGGEFSSHVGSPFSSPFSGAARWDGEEWERVGEAISAGAVHALKVVNLGAGDALYMGGAFTQIGGVTMNHVARWNATLQEWEPLGAGMDLSVRALSPCHFPGLPPSLCAGGEFNSAGGMSASRIARWDGIQWHAIAPDQLTGIVTAMATMDDGSGPALFIAGWMHDAAGTLGIENIARWDGAAWNNLQGGIPPQDLFFPPSLLSIDLGDRRGLLVGGDAMTAGGVDIRNVGLWEGARWTSLGQAPDARVDVLCAHDDGEGLALFAGGPFARAGGEIAVRLARFDGTRWRGLLNLNCGGGCEPMAMVSTTAYGSPALFIGGHFRGLGPNDMLISSPGVVQWDGVALQPAGSGLRPDNSPVLALTVFNDGTGERVYAGGAFQFDGTNTVALNHVAQWNGTQWLPVGSGISSEVYDLAVFDDGAGPRLIAAAGSQVLAWDGVNWSMLGLFNGSVGHTAVFDDGEGPVLYVGGSFTNAGGVAANRVARWGGESWSPLGSGVSSVCRGMTVFDDGRGPALFVYGDFTSAGGVAVDGVAWWNGSQWSRADGEGLGVRTAAVFDDGLERALFVGGPFDAGPSRSRYVAKWGCLPGLPQDCDGNGMNDACEPYVDCNGNGTRDDCEIIQGVSSDLDHNGVPDDCDVDCNGNGLTDSCDVALGIDADCNSNKTLDACDIANNTSEDCAGDSIPDECQGSDCNSNSVLDTCDIDTGASLDADSDGVPDECRVRRVRADAPPGGHGLTWETAYGELSAALAASAVLGSAVRDVWVSAGTYRPDTLGLGNPRTAAFGLRSGLSIYGGFAGSEATRDQRDPWIHITILSGDLGGNDGPDFAGNVENAYHVVGAAGIGPTAVLDGFTITGGNTTGAAPADANGGGIFVNNASPTLQNLVLTRNKAAWGGGMYIVGPAVPTVVNCRFLGNQATSVGGAVALVQANVSLVNCTMAGNFAANGGAVFSNLGSPQFINCTIMGNHATSLGGGLRLAGTGTTPLVANSILWGNTAGAAYTADQATQLNLVSGTTSFFYNRVQDWMGSLGGAGNTGADPLVAAAPDRGGDAWGAGNNDTFGDLHVTPASPCIDAGDNTRLPFDGADLDFDGDTAEPLPLDLDLLSRRVDDPDVADTGAGAAPIVDIGAYERQSAVVTGGACCVQDIDGAGRAGPMCVDANSEAACTALRFVCNTTTNVLPECGGACGTTCFGDVDGNSVVTPGDRGFVAANIGQTAYALLCQYDLDGNGFINAGDRGFVAANIGLCSPLPNYQNGSGLNAAGDGPDGRFAAPVFHGAGTSCAGTVCP